MASKKAKMKAAASKAGAKVKKAARAVKPAAKKAAARVVKAAQKVKSRKAAKPRKVQPIPPGFHTVTPALVVSGASAALEFYKKAFGAKVRLVMPGPTGTIMHAEIQIGDSVVMLGDEIAGMPYQSAKTLGGSPASLMIYSRNVDADFARAVAAGATVVMPVETQFWGDRYGQLMDPFGNRWQIATHVEDVSEQEMARRMEAMPPPTPQVSNPTGPTATA